MSITDTRTSFDITRKKSCLYVYCVLDGHKKSCLYVCCVLDGYTVDAALTVKPINTVAVARSSVILQCGTDRGGSPADIDWIRNPDTASEQRVVDRYSSCRPNSDFPQYSVISSSYGRCDLVVVDASQELAATYRCVDGYGSTADAELTVIGESCVHANYVNYVGSRLFWFCHLRTLVFPDRAAAAHQISVGF